MDTLHFQMKWRESYSEFQNFLFFFNLFFPFLHNLLLYLLFIFKYATDGSARKSIKCPCGLLYEQLGYQTYM